MGYLCIMKKYTDINEVVKFYDITEDGFLYSRLRKRWLKPLTNNCGYIFYFIKPYDRFVFAHTLVALKYIGPPPTEKHEINHIDGDRRNNLYLNLEWVTHSQNQLKAYESGREHYWLGKHKPSPTLETRMLMANAKKKRITYNGKTYESIQDLADGLNMDRRSISTALNQGGLLKGFPVTLIPD
jgi:hypothetical protein